MVNVAMRRSVGSGERHGSVLILEDVTARVRLEEQLQHSEKMASIGILAAGVAHEVNTPLTGISSYTQMLREQIKAEDLRYPLLEKIEKQTFRAAKIINNLLNFSRSGSTELERLDLNKVLLDVLSLLEHQLDRNRVKVLKEFAEDLPPVRGNENRLQQVFFNLILNSRDAMPSGGWLHLSPGPDDTRLIEVRTPEPASAEDSKASTTRSSQRRASAGPGLGLSVSYGICRITVGPLREIVPARERLSRGAAAMVVAEEARNGDRDGEHPRIDDEEVMRDVLHTLLTRRLQALWRGRRPRLALALSTPRFRDRRRHAPLMGGSTSSRSEEDRP